MADRQVILAPRMYQIAVGSVLHRTTTFLSPVYFEHRNYTSIEQVFHACLFSQHGLFAEAETFWPDNQMLNLDPGSTREAVKKYFADRNLEFTSAAWVFKTQEVMERILLTMLRQGNNGFANFLQGLYLDYGLNLKFAEVTTSATERTWSCGSPHNRLPGDEEEFSGANLYGKGKAVTVAFLTFFGHRSYRFHSLYDLFNRVVIRAGYRKTALILSDSTFRHAKFIQGGDIWYQSGATSGDLATQVRTKFGRVTDYHIVVVDAGTNDSLICHTDSDRKKEWKPMKRLLKSLRNHPYCIVLYNTGIGFARWPNVPDYTRWFRHEFDRTFGDCPNFYLIDWSIPSEGNFFLHSDHEPHLNYVDHDRRHPNVSGTRRMWKALAEFNSDIRRVTFETTPHKYVLPMLKDIPCLCL